MTFRKPIFRTRGGDHRPMSAREFILKHLALVGEDTIKHMRSVYLAEMEELRISKGRKQPYRTSSYSSFYKEIWQLGKDHLVEATGQEEESDEPELQSWVDNPRRSIYRLSR